MVLLNSDGDPGGRVAIYVTVVAFGLLDPPQIWKMSTVTKIVGVGVTIPVIVVACKPSDSLGVSKVSTVTRIVGVGVASLVTVVAF